MRAFSSILFFALLVASCESIGLIMYDEIGNVLAKLRFQSNSHSLRIQLPDRLAELGPGYLSITMGQLNGEHLLKEFDAEDIEISRRIIRNPSGIESGQIFLEQEFPVKKPPAAIEIVAVQDGVEVPLPKLFSLTFRTQSQGFRMDDYHIALPRGVRYRQELRMPPSFDRDQTGKGVVIYQEVEFENLLGDFDYLTSIPVIALTYEYSVPENGMPVSIGGSSRDSSGSGIADPNRPTARLDISGSGGSEIRSREWKIRLRPGVNSLYIYPEQLAADPQVLRFTHDSVYGRLRGVRLLSFPRLRPRDDEPENYEKLQPLPADLGTIMNYSSVLWRNPSFELFSWSAVPEILIFDFADYQVQARYFKRLAYFAEKEGFRGEILSNKELANRHGWNAHNYLPQELSRFYNKADEESIYLNDEEVVLRELLLSRGILAKEGRRTVEGSGQIISVTSDPFQSRASRYLFLNHESLHGLFYNFPQLRQSAESIWMGLSEKSREYMRLYFSYMGYDRADEYLMVNEFQAYMLQQKIMDLRWLVESRMAERIARKFPQRSSFVYSNNKQTGKDMLRAAESFQALVYQNTGLVAGDLFELVVE